LGKTMTDEELRNRLFDKEDGWTERKSKGVSTEVITNTAVAFANALPYGTTGILFIGISDKGEIEGVDETDALQQRVRNAVEQRPYPPIRLGHNCRVINVDGKDVVAVIIEASLDRPHFSGQAYMRVGSETVKASLELFDELIASRLSKARPLIEAMRKKEPVSLHFWGQGFNNRLSGATYLGDAQIIECTPGYVVFAPKSTRQISATYDQIRIKKDTYNEGRLKVEVEG
jgi:Predicted transcriptional regulator containing an HTH domain and an uncharacterized domain shared with the mammalian protein Schlafen